MPRDTSKKHVVVELTLDQYALIRSRCAREGKPMSTALPQVLLDWASQTETLESARSRAYVLGGVEIIPRKHTT